MARDKKVNVKISVSNERATSKLGKFKKALLSIKGVIVTGIGLAALNKLLKNTVGRAQSAESGLKRLAVAMRAAGRFTTENVTAFEKLAVTLERQTGFIEEDVLQALSILQTFGQMTRDDMEKTIVAALDMATIFNEDLTQAAIRLGKAYNGQLIGLQRMGVGISKATFNAKGFQAVLDQLATEQGGQARARMAGFEGSIKRIGVGFGEAGKELGKFITNSKTITSAIDAIGGGFNKIADFLRDIRTGQTDAADETQRHTDKIIAQSDALAQLGQQSVWIETSKELAEVRKRLDGFVEANQTVIFSYKELLKTMSEAEAQALILDLGSDREKVLVEFLKEEKKLREDLIILAQNKDIIKTFTDAGKGARDLAKEEERLRDLRKEIADLRDTELIKLNRWYAEQKILHKDNREAMLLVDEIFNIKREKIETESRQKLSLFRADLIRQRVKQEGDAAREEEEIILETGRIAGENLQKRANARQKFEQEKLNIILSVAQKEIDAQQRLVQRLADIRTSSAIEQLKGDDLNAQERKELIQDQIEAAEELTKKISAPKGAQDLENNINKLEQLKESLKGIEGVEDVIEAITEGFKEAATQVEIFGRAKFDPDIDVAAVALKMKTAGEKAFDEFKRGFLARSRANPISLDESNFNPKSSFVNNGG